MSFQFDEPPGPRTNATVKPTDCRTCGGDRFIVVTPATATKGEEVAPCPDCNHAKAGAPA